MSTTPLQERFDEGIRRYEAGESPATLLPLFLDIAQKQPKNGPALTCLAWLYLLAADAPKALKAAKQAVKLAPADAQSHVNLALALLETGQKGVREAIERAQQIVQIDGEQGKEVRKNCEEGLVRRPDWKAMLKVRNWLFES
ncbi:Zn-dependent protease [Gloeobacter kilaueensis]|uniref:Zn-dependent protease, contains TPR repeats n=1 Tax=Gloeobacter kilaueensis (strain ATCC BAA-2537 / CCAP 1431/1 / ULC 316 / JS1) TaxID=1183438 RepID=U5QCQ1_GLOK1|nr:Zn-dependent protease [Gloeobacter kilaueensis]AGY56623.1 Zn-dependent protease, contains TPR repeats [Gloeobacter kilaueensis JS1]